MSAYRSIELDRAVGALLGLAAGDALGAGYEFGPALETAPGMIGGGPLGWEQGEWTDDTQMAICVAEVAATGALDVEEVADGFLRWFAGHPRDVGGQTRAVLSRARHGHDLKPLAEDFFRRHPGAAAGNGSLMRTAPVALAHLGDDDAIADAAEEVSLLTHGDPLAAEACVLWCIGIDRAVREARLDGVKDGLARLNPPSRDRWAAWLEEAEREAPGCFVPNGYVVRALQAAFAAIRHTRVTDEMPCLHLQRALERAVAVGDDTDTVGAIAGQLLGARWGASAFPLAWRGTLHGWPGYRVDDLVRLAILTVHKGEPDPSTGWPTASTLLPYYRRWGAGGTVKALAEDPGVRIGDAVSIAAASEDDIIVSLCRTGTADVPREAHHHQQWIVDHEDPEANPNLDCMLRDLAATVAGWRDEGREVLIHCGRAESRAPTVAAAYLAHRMGIGASEALERVRAVLPGMDPNPAFREALQRLWPP